MKTNRRSFIRTTSLAGMGSIISSNAMFSRSSTFSQKGKRVGMIGLDTSHSIVFTKELNQAAGKTDFNGYQVVAAYPYGSRDIESAASRIPEYTEEVKKFGVEIVDSIDKLLQKVDVVLLETNDGRMHMEQALPVLKAGKRLFIDKPIAASLSDAIAIFKASKQYKVPVFSTSGLRYIVGAKEIKDGELGKITGADAYSPSMIEETHPDLFWYGIHGVEILFTVMGTGCKQVVRIYTEDTDLVVGTWQDNRIGTFRGIRAGRRGFGGTVFGEKGIKQLSGFPGYNPLLLNIVEFFETGIPPVSPEETLEIIAFMEAADESKKMGGASVSIKEIKL